MAKTENLLGEMPREALVKLATAFNQLIRDNKAVRKMYLHDPIYNKFVDLIEHVALRGNTVSYENLAATVTVVIAVSGKREVGNIANDILGVNL